MERLWPKVADQNSWGSILTSEDDLIAALTPVAAAFEQLQVRYYVGGSVASSFHGAMRSTRDVDLVCDIQSSQVDRFLSLIQPLYYASVSAINEAIARRSCFNLIHLPTSFKVDVFVRKNRPYDRIAFERTISRQLYADAPLIVPIASQEDIILAKLEWFRAGGEVSERQWEDITTVVRTKHDKIDFAYLRTWSEHLAVGNLFSRLLLDLGLSEQIP